MITNFNLHIGTKIKFRRLQLGLTQTKLALAINVTFQQIQKYEKGINCLSALRVMQLANFLKVPITYFYEGYYEYNSYKEPTIITVKEEIENEKNT